MKQLQFISIALLLLSVGCASSRSTSKGQSTNLESTAWQIEELEGVAIAAQGEDFTLIFHADNRLNGRGACNIMFGEYKQKNGTNLLLSPQGLTRTACPDMSTEDKFIKMLTTVTSFSIENGDLILMSDDTVVAKLNGIGYTQK